MRSALGSKVVAGPLDSRLVLKERRSAVLARNVVGHVQDGFRSSKVPAMPRSFMVMFVLVRGSAVPSSNGVNEARRRAGGPIANTPFYCEEGCASAPTSLEK